ncbi:prothymosin alpha PTMA transcript variant X2 mRNA [Crotalus adamanteus]|uniref:Prothymosin alpha PTMA transcript variant X2 mRNA n=1 Tax=Crotalus adamanteus TaxID=8729 RepID=A0AAW1BHG8_CROAD
MGFRPGNSPRLAARGLVWPWLEGLRTSIPSAGFFHEVSLLPGVLGRSRKLFQHFGEEEDGDEDDEAEGLTGKRAAEDDEDDDVDPKKQKTDEDD